MDLVTVTDHDSIDAVEELRSRPDFFLSEEVTCTLPGGNQLHVGVYDITERDHVELQRRRHDFESLLAWLVDQDLFFSANHVFSSLTGRRSLENFRLFETAFPALETLNGHMQTGANANAACMADLSARAEVGGSDAHAMASVGCAWTVVPGARNRQEFLQGLRRGMGCVRGENGSYAKLTRDVFSIGRQMVRENPATLPIALLGWMVPLIILHNSIREAVFSRWWMARYMQSCSRRSAVSRIAEVTL
jgi:hypothetical protein